MSFFSLNQAVKHWREHCVCCVIFCRIYTGKWQCHTKTNVISVGKNISHLLAKMSINHIWLTKTVKVI